MGKIGQVDRLEEGSNLLLPYRYLFIFAFQKPYIYSVLYKIYKFYTAFAKKLALLRFLSVA